MWLDLEERFGQSNKARLFQVQKDVSCLSQGDLDIATYYTRAKQLWDEFHAVGVSLNAIVQNVNVKSMADYKNTVKSKNSFSF